MGVGDALGAVWCSIKTAYSRNPISVPESDPRKILAEIEQDNGLKKLAAREIENFQSKHQEGLSPVGAKSMAVVQEGLIALGLLDVSAEKSKNPSCWWSEFKFGSYGDKTIAAVRKLQTLGGINYSQTDKSGSATMSYTQPSGQKFGPESLALLKTALQALASGKDWKAAIKPKQ